MLPGDRVGMIRGVCELRALHHHVNEGNRPILLQAQGMPSCQNEKPVFRSTVRSLTALRGVVKSPYVFNNNEEPIFDHE